MSKAWASKDTATLLKYGGFDAIATACCYAKMRREMTTKRQFDLYEHNKALSRLAAKMHDTGFKVHKENRSFLAWGLEIEYYEKLEYLKNLVQLQGFEGTENQMRAIIWRRHRNSQFHKFDLPDPFDMRMWNDDQTLIKVDYNTLLTLVTNPGLPDELKKIIEAYWDCLEVWKLRSTFVVSPLIDQAIGADGRLRAGWNSLGTDTGRWSCSKPNILNIKQYVRSMYCSETGKVLVHADFSQQELWVMAAVAGDRELFRRLQTGDVYTEDAKDWFRLPKDATKATIKKSARQQAKIVHLASQYGAGIKQVFMQVLSEDRSFTFRNAKLLNDGFMKTYCDTVAYWEDEMKRVAATWYSATRIMDRRKVFPRIPERSQAVNYPIQGTAADVSNLALLEIDARCTERNGAAIVHHMYDSVDIECWEDDQDWARLVLKEAMSKPRKVGAYELSIPIEVKVSTNWAEV